MKAMENYYNIHNILTLKVSNEDNRFRKLFDNIDKEYKHFASVHEDRPDIIIILGKRKNLTPPEQRCYLADGCIIGEDYLYCRDSYKQAKWEVEVKGFESTGTITVNIFCNLWGSMFVTSYIVNRLIISKACEKGYSFIHASCVSRDGRAYLLPARSGAGKTMTSLYFVEKGFDFLGDDFVILYKGEVLCFPTPLNIFRYNVTPLVDRAGSSKRDIIMLLTDLIYKASFGYAKILSHIDVESILPRNAIVEKSKLYGVFLLLPQKNRSEVCASAMSKSELVNRLISSEKTESFPFFKYMVEYSYVFPRSNVAAYWERYESTLMENLRGEFPVYKVEIPERYDPRVFTEILDVVQSR